MKLLHIRFPVLVAIALVLLVACASNPGLRDAERLALYRAHAGAPVASFQYQGHINGWTPLGDSALAVSTGPRQAYLLELAGSCPDLEYAVAIRISNLFGRVHARFDSIHVIDRNTFGIPCRIRQIQPVDMSALKQAEREMRRSVELAERAEPAGSDDAGKPQRP